MEINQNYQNNKCPNEIRLEKDEKSIIGSNIFPTSYYHKDLINLEKCICKIVIGKNTCGTGFLLKLVRENKLFYFLISCEHVLEKDLIDNKKKIEINYNYNYIEQNVKNKKITIKLDEKERFIRRYTYLDIDASVVQIFPEKKEIEEEYFYEIKNFNNINKYEILKNNNIHILQFQLG